MRRQLRLATALRGKEAQRDHFTLTRAQATARVVVAEAVAGKPLVDVSRIFGAGLRESTHSFTEDFDLLVFARPGTRFRRGGALRFKRKMHVGRAEKVVEFLQERQGFAETTVCGRLIHHFLDGDGRQSGFVGHRQHHFESIQACIRPARQEWPKSGFCHPNQDGSLPVRSPLRHKRNSRRIQ